MKNILFTGLLLWGSGTTFAQTQLTNWLQNSTQINLTTSSPTTSPVANGIFPDNRAYNCRYDNQGNLEFYINRGILYNKYHTALMNLGSYQGSEYAIIPNPANAVNLCSKKYYIVANRVMPSVGELNRFELDLNGNNGLGTCTGPLTLSQSGGPTLAMAVSRLNANNNRFLYTAVSGGNVRIYKFTTAGMTVMGNYPVGVAALTTEMELSNDGTKLAFLNSSGKISVLTLSASGIPSGLPAYQFDITGNSGFSGLEFDNTGNKLFYSVATVSGSNGVYVINAAANGSTSSFIGGTQAYNGMLEKSYNGTQIICGNASVVRGIDPAPATPVLNGWTANFAGTFMPDQIDGEDYSGGLLSVTGNPFICHNGAGTLAINVGASIVGFGGYVVEVKDMTTNAFVLYTAQTNLSVSVSPSVSTQYQVKLYHTSNPSCSITKSWIVRIYGCDRLVVSPIIHPVISGRMMLTGESEDPAFEQNHAIESVWSVEEVSPETNETIYTIETPSCWQTPNAEPTTFMGFNTDLDYANEVTLFNCQSGSGEGIFNPEKKYIITRTSISNEFGTEINAVYVDKGVVFDGSPVEKKLLIPAEGTRVEEQTFVIYPNPSSGMVNINTNGALPETIQVYNLAGVKVFEQCKGLDSIDLSSLLRGVYTIKIYSGDKTEVYRIVLQ
jgi:hypothetical protein